MNKGNHLRIRRNRVMDFLRSVNAEAIRRSIIVMTTAALLILTLLPDEVFAITPDLAVNDNSGAQAEGLTKIYPKEVDHWLAVSPVWNERNTSPISDFIEESHNDDMESQETYENETEVIEDNVIEEEITQTKKMTKVIPEEIIEEEPIEMDENYHFDYITGDTIIKMPSGLTPEAIDEIFINTNLYGVGQAIYDIEQEYGICAYFTMAVCAWESGHGTSDMALYDNNICGILGFEFDSFDDCIHYFGELMHVYEYDCDRIMSINGIGPKYCDYNWAPDITSKTNEYIAKANELFSI